MQTGSTTSSGNWGLPDDLGRVLRVDEEPHAQRDDGHDHADVQEELERPAQPAPRVVLLVARREDPRHPQVQPVEPEERRSEQGHGDRDQHQAHQEVPVPGVRHSREEPQQPVGDTDPEKQAPRSEQHEDERRRQAVEDTHQGSALHGLGSDAHLDHRHAHRKATVTSTAISPTTAIDLTTLTPYITCQEPAMPRIETISSRARRPSPRVWRSASTCSPAPFPHPPIGALGFAPQKTRVPNIEMTWTRTMLSTIDVAVAVPTPTGPPDAV